MTTTAQPEQTFSIGRLHKKFAIARWLQGSSMLQSSLMSISKLLSVLTEMNSGRPNLSVSKFSTTTVDNFVDYSSWCRGDQPQRHVSADRLNSRHRKFISVHDLHATRFFSGMGHSLAKGRSRQQTASGFLWLKESILSAWVGVREAGCNIPTETILSAGFPVHRNVSRAMSGFGIHPKTCYSPVNFDSNLLMTCQ